MADQSPTVTSINPYDHLQIVHNSDDTLTRLLPVPNTAATGDINPVPGQSVLTKDIPLNTAKNTWLRLFRPINGDDCSKLPLIIYIHGGGFIIASAGSTIFHDFCSYMATKLPVMIVSVEYRLAPENRLPAAYEDVVDAMIWVRHQAVDINGEQWLKANADFSRCFLMGNSAGGNIAYHAGLRALPLDLEPLKITGLIFHQPFFGGSERTGSELRLANDRVLPLPVTDLCWELGLPNGVDRDHEYCNPMVDGGHRSQIGLLGKCLVNGCSGDPLIDRQIEFVKMLEGKGVRVMSRFDEGAYHGVEFDDPKTTEALVMLIKDFISPSFS